LGSARVFGAKTSFYGRAAIPAKDFATADAAPHDGFLPQGVRGGAAKSLLASTPMP
jgi:hypothetical protein